MLAAQGGSLDDVVLQFERILIHQNKFVLQDAGCPANATKNKPI